MRFESAAAGRISGTMRTVGDEITNVLSAYERFAAGDPSQLIDVLDPEIVWRAQGSKPHVGRDDVARRLTEMAGPSVQLVGVRRGASVVVLEFTRPWWRVRNGRLRYSRSILGIHGEQAIWIKDGLISKIESRERLAADGA